MNEPKTFSQENASWLFLVLLIGVIVLASFVFFWRLGAKPLENWDEGIHAEVSREMYRQGTWVSLSYHDMLYTAKPPLKFWLTTPLFPVFGETEFAVRLWSALSGVGVTVLIAAWAWQQKKNYWFAAIAASLFLSGRFVLFHAFRTGETDGLFVLLFVLTLYGYWRSWESNRWLVVCGVMVGLAVMTKSFAGLLPVIIIALDLTLRKAWSRLGISRVMQAAALAAAIALPWHAVELLRHGSTFWDGYFTFHIFERASEVLYKNYVPWHWYAEIVFKRTFPFSLFVVFAVVQAFRRSLQNRDTFDRFLLLWVGVVFVVFSLVRTKFDWYILPLYPGLVLILARGWHEFFRERERAWLRWSYLTVFAGTLYLLPQGVAHDGLLWKLTPYGYLPEIFSASILGQLVVGIVSAFVLAAVLFVLRTQTVVHAQRAVGVTGVVYLFILACGWQVSFLRHLPTSAPLKEIAVVVADRSTKRLDVVGVNLLTQPAGYFYLRRVPDLTVREVKDSSQLSSSSVLTTTAPEHASLRGQGSVILQRDAFVLLDLRPQRMP